MGLIPEPIFFAEVKKNSGAKRKLINIASDESETLELEIRSVDRPEWIEIEELKEGTKVVFKPQQRRRFIVNLNTTHRYFPEDKCLDEKIVYEFEDDTILELPITIGKIDSEVSVYPGIYALDFGTSNSCFGWKNRFDATQDPTEVFRPAKTSEEIPSCLFFKDVAHRQKPKYVIGTEALYDIKEFSHQTYSYFMSIKRLLGSDREFYVLDDHAGLHHENRQQWTVEEICSFIIEEILKRAEADVGGKIERVVATYPTLYSIRKKNALRRAFGRAFKRLGVEMQDDSLILNLDEANAAAFNFIYETLLEEFRSMDITERQTFLLSYDFGGGTTDVSLLDVKISRDEQGKIYINTDLKGVTGDLFYGGDNVTLSLFRILKTKLALAINEKKREARQAKEATQRQEADIWAGNKAPKAAEPEDDIWGSGGSGDDDIWSGGAAEKKEEETKPSEEAAADPDLENIENKEDPDAYESYFVRLDTWAEVFERSCREEVDFRELYEERCKDLGRPFDRRELEQLINTIECIIPTKFRDYRDVDPFKEATAKELFYELWHEAETLKIMLVASKDREVKISNVLKKTACYTGVDPMLFNEAVKISMDELDARVSPDIERNIKKAFNLYTSSLAGEQKGIRVRSKSKNVTAKLKVLLAGNSSKLPIVRDRVLSIFNLDESDLHLNPRRLKKAVAQGACEEYSILKEFGEGGLINYNSNDFLERFPYSVGLYHKDLALVGYKGGFCPIFTRGDGKGTAVTLDSESNFLIHDKLTDLALYADYHDGTGPVYLGKVDFRNPLDKEYEPEEEEGAEAAVAEAGDPFADDDEPAAAPEAAGPVAPEEPQKPLFRLRFMIRDDREIQVADLQTLKMFQFEQVDEEVTAERDPFSGVH